MIHPECKNQIDKKNNGSMGKIYIRGKVWARHQPDDTTKITPRRENDKTVPWGESRWKCAERKHRQTVKRCGKS